MNTSAVASFVLSVQLTLTLSRNPVAVVTPKCQKYLPKSRSLANPPTWERRASILFACVDDEAAGAGAGAGEREGSVASAQGSCMYDQWRGISRVPQRYHCEASEK